MIFYYLLLFILSTLTYFLYKDSLTYPFFIFDDYDHYLYTLSKGNDSLIDLITIHKTAIPFFYKAWSLILSLTEAKYHLIYLRFFNIILHLINSILTFYLILEITPIRRKVYYQAFFATLLFFLHPLQVESVVWVSSMKGVLATFLTLSSWLIFLKYRSVTFYILSILLFTLALMTKVTVVPAPLIFILLAPTTKSYRLRSILPYLIIGLLFSCYQIWSYQPGIHHHIKWYITHTVYQYKTYLLSLIIITTALLYWFKRKKILIKKYIYRIALVVTTLSVIPWLVYYLFIIKKLKNIIFISYYSIYKSLLPTSYGLDYGINDLFITRYFNNLDFIILLTTLVFTMLYLYRKSLYSFKLILSIGLLCAPHLGLISFHFSKSSFFADRFMYFPLILISYFIVSKLLFNSKKYFFQRITIIIILLTVYSIKSYRNIMLWKTNETVLQESLKINSFSLITLMSLAHNYEKQGKVYKAMATYHNVSMRYPNFQDAYIKRIKLLIKIKRYDTAIDYIKHIMKKFQNFSPSLFKYLGESYFLKEEYTDALHYYNKYQRSSPQDINVKFIIMKLEEFAKAKK